MKTVQRHDNWLDFIWALTRSLYYLFGIPSLIFLAFASIIIYSNNGPTKRDPEMVYIFILVWAALIIPLVIRRLSILRRRRQLKQMVTLLSSDARFSPQKRHQVLDAGRGKYLGIDIKHGNILYIHMVKKGFVDITGLTMNDWTDRELEGSTLRLNTKNPEMPMLSINAHPIVVKELFNTLGAMSHNSYSESFPQESWPLHVGLQSRFVQFEHDVVVPQVV